VRHVDHERLRFLCNVVRRETALLMQSTQELLPIFESNSDAEIALLLPTHQRLNEAIELFAGRFSRLQDTVGDKLLEYLMAEASKLIAPNISS
jgi:hypothetical protein